jgi:hypothetical protein
MANFNNSSWYSILADIKDSNYNFSLMIEQTNDFARLKIYCRNSKFISQRDYQKLQVFEIARYSTNTDSSNHRQIRMEINPNYSTIPSEEVKTLLRVTESISKA